MVMDKFIDIVNSQYVILLFSRPFVINLLLPKFSIGGENEQRVRIFNLLFSRSPTKTSFSLFEPVDCGPGVFY